MPASWFTAADAGSMVSPELLWSPVVAARAAALAAPASSVWQVLPGIVAPLALVGAAGDGAPRHVVGSDFQSSMLTAAGVDAIGEAVPAGERRVRTGRAC